MTQHFSDVDRRLLAYLRAKERFTENDSIMAGAQKTRSDLEPELTDSWAHFSSGDDDGGESGDSLDIQESETDQQSPALSTDPEETDLPDVQSADVATPNPRGSVRKTRQLLGPQNSSPRTPQAVRSSPRLQVRQSSKEPELIMPSIIASGSFKSSTPKQSPLSNSVRARKGNALSSSRAGPARATQETPKSNQPKSPTSRRRKPSQDGTAVVPWIWQEIVRPTLQYALGVIGHTMVYLKPWFGALLAIFTIFYGFKLVFQSSLSALSVVPHISKLAPSPCSLPILSRLPICGPQSSPKATPEFEDLINVQSSFEDILQSTAQGSILPLEMKRSEASIRDLKYVVTYSHLPSKGELVYEFQGFIDVARQAAGDLTKFNSRVGRAVDHIISTNKHTLQVIDGFVSFEASQGVLSKWLCGSSGLTQDHLLRQYLLHTSQVEEQIQRLIIEAQVLLKILEDLDGRLDVIHSIVTRDGVHVKDSRDELFAQLWTKLGGNRNSVQKLNEQLSLLKSVNTYRKAAWSHVTATLLKLQAISAGLEDLRERVALPETVGVETVPLQQHIETIQLGVERLERVRESSRGLEMEGQRRMLENGGVLGKDRQVEG
ncbi:uncharacterized protein PV09_00895 [Verruconis gallopava]|uniref:Uncharacterized protein n=1 Tax=Verruconis gallopava TaxID=253628 RepID=A0A0D1Z7S1_9PEZI|nr:uncharacterized protein PV09_00895 [Verruconis gallopava]KIW08997.1 hypothetical protein PV09_00895 [Verruconis gallopava]